MEAADPALPTMVLAAVVLDQGAAGAGGNGSITELRCRGDASLNGTTLARASMCSWDLSGVRGVIDGNPML